MHIPVGWLQLDHLLPAPYSCLCLACCISQVVVREWPNPNIPNQFFRMMHDEVPLMVGPCGHFFEQDEYEMVSFWMQGAGWGEPAATLSAGSWSHVIGVNQEGHGAAAACPTKTAASLGPSCSQSL